MSESVVAAAFEAAAVAAAARTVAVAAVVAFESTIVVVVAPLVDVAAPAESHRLSRRLAVPASWAQHCSCTPSVVQLVAAQFAATCPVIAT